MEIRFLGTWSSNLVKGERNISFLVDGDIMFDFSPHAIESLLDMDIDPCSVSTVLISHMHLDHYMGLAELMWYRSIYKARNDLVVIGPEGIEENTRNLLKCVNTPPPWYGEQIDTNVEFREKDESGTVEIYRGDHTIQDNGYRLTHKGKTIFYSGDTSYSPEIVTGASGVDYLLHEATYTDDGREHADFWKHSTLSDALRAYSESGARHFIPVHLRPESRQAARNLAGSVKGLIMPAPVINIE